MSNDFHLHFVRGKSFDIDFHQQAQPSQDSVFLNRKWYALSGNESQVADFKKLLPELFTGLSLEGLRSRLRQKGATDIDTATKTDHVGMAVLSGSEVEEKSGKWMVQERANLPANRRRVAEKYWAKHSEKFKEMAEVEIRLEYLKRRKI